LPINQRHPEFIEGEPEFMSAIYQLKVQGALDDMWSDWFTGMTIQIESASDGTSITTLSGPVADQASLRGMVSKIWDLNLTLISVTRIGPDRERPDVQPGGEQWENS
jgi:hypothetical protein